MQLFHSDGVDKMAQIPNSDQSQNISKELRPRTPPPPDQMPNQWQIQEFLNGERSRRSGGCLEAPSRSRAKPWWGSMGAMPPEADEFLHVKGVFSLI
jgi:hypothetical protein